MRLGSRWALWFDVWWQPPSLHPSVGAKAGAKQGRKPFPELMVADACDVGLSPSSLLLPEHNSKYVTLEGWTCSTGLVGTEG